MNSELSLSIYFYYTQPSTFALILYEFFCSFLSITRCSIAYLMAWCMAHLGMYACVLCIVTTTLHDRCTWGSELSPCQIGFVEYKLIDRWLRAVVFSFISNNQKTLIHRIHDMLLFCVYFGGRNRTYRSKKVPLSIYQQVKGKMKTKNEYSSETNTDVYCAEAAQPGQTNQMNFKKQISTISDRNFLSRK